MGAVSKSQWGRSFVSTNSNVENQLVRVRLPQPRDVTLYLQPLRDVATGLPVSAVATYKITIGSGGIALVNTWIPAPQVGVARHFVSDAVDVTAIVTGSSTRSIAANLALGTPYDAIEAGPNVDDNPSGVAIPVAKMQEYLTKRPSGFSWKQVDPGTDPLFRIPPFATHVQIRVRANNGAAASEMLVFHITPTGGYSINSTFVGDYATPQPLNPDGVLLALRCTNANPLIHYDALVTFTVKM